MTTDIWSWVQDTHRQLAESGQHRLADALVEIAGHAVEGRNEQLDAMFPEALASARALGLPWVEVFLRHWRLQNLLNKRHQGEAAMSEAVSLLEFAHREETASCPQSVCAVQDFTICHANIDGPGYVPERLAVLEEALQRVEPARACFDCLSREYADTLEDDGRPADALAHLDRAETRIRAAGERASLSFAHSRVSALHRLGRHQDALDAFDTAERAYVAAGNRLDDDDRRKLAVGRALQHAALGRFGTALELLPDAEEADRYPDIRHRWAAAVELLVAAGEFENDAELGGRLASWAGESDLAGSHRPCLDLVLLAGGLALGRGAREVALTLARTGERKLGQLRSTAGVAERVAALRAAAEALPHPELPVPAEELPRWLGENQPDPETGADLLAAALAAAAAAGERPDTVLVVNLATVLGVLGHTRAVTELAWNQLELDPGHEYLTGMLGQLLIDAEDGEGVDRLATRIAAADPADAHWLRARWAAAQGRWEEVGEQCAAVLAHSPDALNTRRLAASAATRRGEHAEAQRLYEELLAHALDPAEAGEDEQHRTVQGPDLWHLVTAATANRDWAAVRAAGARLGIEFDTDSGPVEEEWQLVEVRVRRANGTTTDLPALRTGPATARVLPVLGDDIDLNHGDVVVFAPAVLNDRPEPGDDEAEDWRPVFEHLTLLDPAGYTTYWLDGGRPAAHDWHALRDALREAGHAVWVYSGDEYRIADPADPDGSLPGVYAALGVPPTATAADTDALLTTLTAGLAHPLAWPALAEAAGADTARHEKIVDDYGL
ncbi:MULTISPECIES: hypothetical protein [Kitasatospora]|uniref:Tetratricopeptide repeat protein n=1 Tax=Kitasatospora setae (strain ATCC 33774 / DSM 43861 / JCM 3304 / KCC A-0304 / NBRC 14216 / KM-6054) TaxID=452652 RepID=E4NDP0_KITSK|nr:MULTISPECIES: hypothetical protein [Kitasatospora]BAJ29321.1 hypothetical protein KSE_35140 [Kitasatospora setae KM-6054]